MLAKKISKKKRIDIINIAKSESNKLDWFFGERKWKKLFFKSINSLKFWFSFFESFLKRCLRSSSFKSFDGCTIISLKILFLWFLKIISNVAAIRAPETKNSNVPCNPKAMYLLKMCIINIGLNRPNIVISTDNIIKVGRDLLFLDSSDFRSEKGDHIWGYLFSNRY